VTPNSLYDKIIRTKKTKKGATYGKYNTKIAVLLGGCGRSWGFGEIISGYQAFAG
jgi:hypothetical protein